VNVLKPHQKSTVFTLLQNQVSQREISRKTGIDRKTIRRLAQEMAGVLFASEANSSTLATGSQAACEQIPPPRPPAGEAPRASPCSPGMPAHARSACEPHREWIEAQVRLGRNATAIYQDLVDQFGFTQRYNSVKRFCRGLRAREPEQFDRLEFLPGEEAQVDYGEGAPSLYPGSARYRKPRLFVMTLRYSRRSYRQVVWKSSSEAWAQLHEQAFRYFGGCPQYVVLDNLKEGVITPDIYEPQINRLYSAVLAHYGVVADPARIRDPNRKGSVENAIQHTQATALDAHQN
jgi:transposase